MVLKTDGEACATTVAARVGEPLLDETEHRDAGRWPKRRIRGVINAQIHGVTGAHLMRLDGGRGDVIQRTGGDVGQLQTS
jgi:hypothetical protein